jgi:hypothetical protein
MACVCVPGPRARTVRDRSLRTVRERFLLPRHLLDHLEPFVEVR